VTVFHPAIIANLATFVPFSLQLSRN